VSHPNIVALHDMGEDPEWGLYLVFEYVEGSTLKERLERGPLGAITSSKLAGELGGALMVAHEAGVLHRDIKPENIILKTTGAKIADFGIARIPDSTLTLGGALLGTPAYSAPEAVSDGKFSPKSDQFSMASTMYEAISGKRAFPGDDAVVVARKIQTDEPVPIAASAGVDTHVDSVLARAFSKDPRDRFETCEEFGNALSEALRMAPRSAMPTRPDQVHLESKEATSHRVAQAATGGIAVGAMLAVAVFQLTAQLREDAHGDAPAARVVTEQRPLEAEPVAWLAERPKTAKSAAPRSRGEHPPGARGTAASAAGPGEPVKATRIRADAGAALPDAGRGAKLP
jgi:serine/threonine-protein kinase